MNALGTSDGGYGAGAGGGQYGGGGGGGYSGGGGGDGNGDPGGGGGSYYANLVNQLTPALNEPGDGYVQISSVPEPSAFLNTAVGALGLMAYARHRRKPPAPSAAA
jgi:hypothetical protein